MVDPPACTMSVRSVRHQARGKHPGGIMLKASQPTYVVFSIGWEECLACGFARGGICSQLEVDRLYLESALGWYKHAHHQSLHSTDTN